MKVSVTKENVVITESSRINEGEYRVNKCSFQLPDCFEGLTVTAAFDNVPVPLFGNECYIPSLKRGTSTLGVYAYKETDDGLQLMYSPKPTSFYVSEGSYNEDMGQEETPEISLFEKYCEEISELAIPRNHIVNEFDIESEIPEDYLFSAKATVELAEIFATEIQNDRDSIEALGEKYDDFSCRVEERMLEVENREIVHECIKGNKTSKETVVLSDISPVMHNMDIFLFNENYSDYSNINVTVHGKNLFGFDGRSVKSFGDGSNAARRSFTGDGIYIGVTGNNYVNPNNIGYIVDSEENEIKVDCRVSWYGVGIDIPVKPGEIYTSDLKAESIIARIVCSFYSSDGEYLSMVQGTNMKITVPENAYWMLCILASSRVADGVSFKEVQLEKGSNATEFCKYEQPQIMKSDGNGNVVGVKSVYPVTIIEADNGDVDISVDYNRDVNIAFNELRDAVISLGGTL